MPYGRVPQVSPLKPGNRGIPTGLEPNITTRWAKVSARTQTRQKKSEDHARGASRVHDLGFSRSIPTYRHSGTNRGENLERAENNIDNGLSVPRHAI